MPDRIQVVTVLSGNSWLCAARAWAQAAGCGWPVGARGRTRRRRTNERRSWAARLNDTQLRAGNIDVQNPSIMDPGGARQLHSKSAAPRGGLPKSSPVSGVHAPLPARATTLPRSHRTPSASAIASSRPAQRQYLSFGRKATCQTCQMTSWSKNKTVEFACHGEEAQDSSSFDCSRELRRQIAVEGGHSGLDRSQI